MKVKHTHPQYQSPEQRRQALMEANRSCAALVSALRDASRRKSA